LFSAIAAVALAGGVVTVRFAIETKGKVLEEPSPRLQAASCACGPAPV
jgi:putative MFS transporter